VRTITLILLIGAVIRLHALGQDARFHPDEALFATFARHAALNGDWLLHGSLDKPPLAIYAQALSMTVFARTENTILNFDFRTGEIAARLPSTFAHILLIAVVYALARRWYVNRRAALWAALIAACSPVAVTFSATAFTDGLMLLCMALALWSVSRARWLWSGVWLALAFGCKQQGLFYAPLVIAFGWALYGLSARRLALIAAPIGIGALLLIAWDAARGQTTSLWTLAATNNTPMGIAAAADILPRLGAWTELGRLILGTPTFLLIGAAALAVIVRSVRAARLSPTVLDVLLAVYALTYTAAHVLIGFNLYDRYLLPLLPPLALLGARGGLWLWAWLSRVLPQQEAQVLAGVIALILIAGG
jgi:4-amino-4-deoxy-L-arabinose transferase-like glycosyltransferase